MYIIYIDESGDVGLENSPTRFFCLSGLVIHESHWLEALDAVVTFRRGLREQYGLKLREEIHASSFVSRKNVLTRIPKSIRLRILRDVIDFEAQLPHISVINIVLDKQHRTPGFDVFSFTWKALIQRFHNTIVADNFPGPADQFDGGLLVVDQTEAHKLQTLLRRMRRHNVVPGLHGLGPRQLPVTSVIEDPNHRDSRHSFFTQMADVNVYFLTQKHRPNQYVKRKGARNYFDRLDPVLCKVASINDPQGVVRL